MVVVLFQDIEWNSQPSPTPYKSLGEASFQQIGLTKGRLARVEMHVALRGNN